MSKIIYIVKKVNDHNKIALNEKAGGISNYLKRECLIQSLEKLSLYPTPCVLISRKLVENTDFFKKPLGNLCLKIQRSQRLRKDTYPLPKVLSPPTQRETILTHQAI